MKRIVGKNFKMGVTPAVVLCNPKYPRNVGAVVRAASAYGVSQVIYTGDRIVLEEGERLPREERMRGYGKVELFQFDYPFDIFQDATPVAIEVRQGCEQLPWFEHPENAVYVFGPEDGSIPEVILRHCHRFVAIPTRHCLNLSMAVGTVLYDRQSKMNPEAHLDFTLEEKRLSFGNYEDEEG
jgi:tRNA(Leu) C34 or U34 (ribose-2'-O)-methylase TrmL